MKNKQNITKFIDEALAIQAEEARETGTLGYMARMLVQATMPHSKPKDNSFTRSNGYYSLTMIGDPDYGLPYGSIPRLLMSWITTEVVQTKKPELVLGDSLSDFMRKIDLIPTGGRWGSVTRLKEQIKRLISCSIRFKYEDKEQLKIKNIIPVEEATLFWTPRNPGQGALFESTISLSKPFFEEIANSPIVYRLDTLKLLKQSSMAVDIYIWITYRNYSTKKPFNISWETLQLQFGAGYPFTERGKLNFKRKFLEALRKVAIAYPEAAKLKDTGATLLFVPGKTDVSERKR